MGKRENILFGYCQWEPGMYIIEARKLFSRDGVLGPFEYMGPRGGNMSYISSPLLSEPTSISTASTKDSTENYVISNSKTSPAVSSAGCFAPETTSKSSNQPSNDLILDSLNLNNQQESLQFAPTSLVSVGYVSEATELGAPSGCWQSANLSKMGEDAAVSCVEERPPVLGKETVDGSEAINSDLNQGDGWGECPALVNEDSPDDCLGLDGGSSEDSSSTTASNPTEWARSLEHLLSDPNGVNSYMKFLEEETGCSYPLTFYFACEGLGKQSPGGLSQLLPLIWKKYIRSYSVPVSPETHAVLAEKIHGNQLTADMFKDGQKEVYSNMSMTTYPAFLESPQFIEKVQEYQQRTRFSSDDNVFLSYPIQKDDLTVDNSLFNNNKRLDTLYEQDGCGTIVSNPNSNLTNLCRGVEGLMIQGNSSEKNVDKQEASTGAAAVRLTRGSLARTALQRAIEMPMPGPNVRIGPLNPYHLNYRRGHYSSRQDSEGRSMSSGKHTEDTKSFTTDGSYENGNTAHSFLRDNSSNNQRRHKVLMKEHIRRNEEIRNRDANGSAPMQEFVIPRTQRQLPINSSIPKNPKEFASLLTMKLEALKNQAEAKENRQKSFKDIKDAGGSLEERLRKHASSSLPPDVLTNKIQKLTADMEEDATSILDNHVSRVWPKDDFSPLHPPSTPPHPNPPYHLAPPKPSSNTSPLHSKGKIPSSKSGGNLSANLSMPPGGDHQRYYLPPSGYWNRQNARGQHDVYSTFSSDSGNVADYCDNSSRAYWNGRPVRHGMPKTRSVPEHMSHSIGTSPSIGMYQGNFSGAHNTVVATADLTDSGVSVISGSRHSLLTTTTKQRVENWLDESNENSSKGSSCRGGTRPLLATHELPSAKNCGASQSSGKNKSFAVMAVGSHSTDYRYDGRKFNRLGNPNFPHSPELRTPPPIGGGSLGGAGNISLSRGSSNPPFGGYYGTNEGVGSTGSTISKGSTGVTKKLDGSEKVASKPSSNNPSTKRSGGSDTQSSCSGARSIDSRCTTGTGSTTSTTESTTVVYSFSDDTVPFVIRIPARIITLKKFKLHLPKKGNYRFFFKKHCEEFGVILEEMCAEEDILPTFDGKIFATIRKAD